MSEARELVVVRDDDDGRRRYRAELWVRPYSGWCLAFTRWVNSKTWATRDGKRLLKWTVMHKN